MAETKSFTQKIAFFGALRKPKIVVSSNTEVEQQKSEENVLLRRVYTSEHMLSLRNQEYCLKKPANLPEVDIVLEASLYKFNGEFPNFQPLTVVLKLIPDGDAYVVSKENDRSFREYLRVLIERGFEDTDFCGTFCQNIIALEAKNEGNTGFKSFLNTFIEIEFEKVVYVKYEIEAKKKQWEEAGDVRLKNNLQQQLTIAKHWYHIKLGIAKLIGELYRIGVLNIKLVMRAIEKLLFIGGNESLESLYWLCYQITDKLRKDCSDYVEKTGIQTDLFSFYVLKLNEYLMCVDLTTDVRTKIEKLIQAVNGFDQTSITKNGSGDQVNTSEGSPAATFEFD